MEDPGVEPGTAGNGGVVPTTFEVRWRTHACIMSMALAVGILVWFWPHIISTAQSHLRPAETAPFLNATKASSTPVPNAANATSPVLERYMKFTMHPDERPAAAQPRPSILPAYYNTRGCICKDNWRAIVAQYPPPPEMPRCISRLSPAEAAAAATIPGESVCTCGGVECPPAVTPGFLTDATSQLECSLRMHTGYRCTARCSPLGSNVSAACHRSDTFGSPRLVCCRYSCRRCSGSLRRAREGTASTGRPTGRPSSPPACPARPT